jgi:hypothetical protein
LSQEALFLHRFAWSPKRAMQHYVSSHSRGKLCKRTADGMRFTAMTGTHCERMVLVEDLQTVNGDELLGDLLFALA